MEATVELYNDKFGRLDVSAMRPYIGSDGRCYITVYTGGDQRDIKNYKAVPTNYATLFKDEWRQLDEAVMKAAQKRLVGINDLVQNGLVYNLTNAMGTPVLMYNDIAMGGEARITMDGVNRGLGDRPEMKANYLPIPLTTFDFELDARTLEVTRRMGNPLDTTMAETGARLVAEKLEKMLFTDTSYSFGEKDDKGRNTIYSYLSHPDINLATLGTAWSSLTSNIGTTIVGQVLTMKKASIEAMHYGPWVLYVPTAYETVLDKDYDDAYPSTTIRDRILKIAGIQDVKVIDMLPANHVLLVQMTSDVVRLVTGVPIQTVEWSTEGRFVNKYKVMTIQVPQVRSDANGKTGIVLLS